MRETYSTDVLVIGGGLAGERAAIEAAREGQNVIVLSLVPPRRSHSSAAQGGFQASLGNVAKGKGDNPSIHFLDTVKGSDWGADQEVARIFADTVPNSIREMAHHGVPWNRVKGGPHQYFIKGKKVTVEEDYSREGYITARDFGGTAKWRACYTSDGTGHTVLYTTDSMAVELGVEVHQRVEAVALIHDKGKCFGAIVRDLRDGSLKTYFAKSTIIATGGFGRIYGASTNAVINEGTGNILALNTGVVPLGNMEAVQFHPTGIVPTDILVTEGCRGDGGFLLDKNEERFMHIYEPEKQELASRDVVSRWMREHINKGLGVDSPFGQHLWLDIRHLGEEHITTKLREVYDICMYFIGVNPVHELIPVRPTQHYSMGGIRTNKDGHVYNMEGLFSAGESACWDMHGFNRLGGNSIAETVVAGEIAGRNAARYARGVDLQVSSALADRFEKNVTDKMVRLYANKGKDTVEDIKREMSSILLDKVGIFRNGDDLGAAKNELQDLYHRALNVRVTSRVKGVNPELTAAMRIDGMVQLAMTVAWGAEARKESRGAHTREDYPERDDNKWLNRTLARWPLGGDKPVLKYEPVGLIDVPPGSRGYGKGAFKPMKKTITAYNRDVDRLQKKSGRIDPVEKIGSRLKKGLWKKEIK